LHRFSDLISSDPILAPLSSLIAPLLPTGFNRTEFAKNEVQNGSIELQYIQRWDRSNLIFGGGYTHQEKTRASSTTPSLTSPLSADLPQQLEQQLLDPELPNIVIDSINGLIRDNSVEPFENRFDESDSNAYAYISTEIFDDLNLTLGAAFHSLDQDNTQGSTLDFSHQYILPKIGAVWRPLASTTVRAAWLKNLKRPFASGQTIEPTHIAGFNQLYDDADAARSERYGFALDQVFLMGIKAGLEISWRDVNIPIFITGEDAGVRWVRQNEKAHRIYIYWTPMDRLAFAAQYFFESFDREPRIGIFGGEPIKLTTPRAPLSLSYYSHSGLFSNFTATYINQDVVVRGLADSDFPQSDRFWILDASVGYRLPKRWGIINLGVRNLLDEKFSFQDANFNPFAVIEGELLPSPFVPERVLYAQITLAF
jgi:outer membrane receptor protein involved in Fe transport